MKFILTLVIGLVGQSEPMFRQFPQESLGVCLSNLTRFLNSEELLKQPNVLGLSGGCQIIKPAEQESRSKSD